MRKFCSGSFSSSKSDCDSKQFVDGDEDSKCDDYLEAAYKIFHQYDIIQKYPRSQVVNKIFENNQTFLVTLLLLW